MKGYRCKKCGVGITSVKEDLETYDLFPDHVCELEAVKSKLETINE